MAKKINNDSNDYVIKEEHIPNSMVLYPVDQNEIILHIGSLKNKCSSGIDGISVSVLKKIHRFICHPLQHIINTIFSTGIVPSHFKQSLVVPIYKSGSHTNIANYRPISIISNVAKIFEKCIKSRIISFLEKYKLLSESQYGFRKGKNTEMAIYELIDFINNSLNDNKKCIAIFLDLAKAFDTVSHNLLIDRLEKIGIRGLALEIIKNYLQNRKQVVKINNTLSEPGIVEIGVPQGTVLGPILFLIYINCISALKNNNFKIISYADDTVLLFNNKDWDLVNNQSSIGLSTVQKWLDRSFLTLNHQKTKFISFSPSNTGCNLENNITLHKNNCKTYNNCSCNNYIESVEKIKYLGVIIDQHLKWRHHVEFVTSKLQTLIPVFYNIRHVLNTKQLIVIYKALVESILRYAIIIWGGTYESTLKYLQTSQNRVIKVMSKNSKRYPTKQLYAESNLLNIKMIYALQSCIFIHTNNDKSYVNHSYQTRTTTNSLIEQKLYKKSLCQHFVSFTGPKFYNKLPISIRSTVNVKKFICLAKEYIKINF